jgi:hypothetical protein
MNLPVKYRKPVQVRHNRVVRTRYGFKRITINPRNIRPAQPQRHPLMIPRNSPLVNMPKQPEKSPYEAYLANSPNIVLGGRESSMFGEGIVTMPACPICGRPVGNAILMVKDTSKPFTHQPVVSQVCEECFKQHLGKGVIMFVMKNDKWTGKLFVVKETIFRQDDQELRSRTAFVTEETAKRMNLPLEEPDMDLKQAVENLKKSMAESDKATEDFVRMFAEMKR